MTLMMMIVAAWLLSLAVFVALKVRRPKWEYPSPPARRVADHRLYDAA